MGFINKGAATATSARGAGVSDFTGLDWIMLTIPKHLMKKSIAILILTGAALFGVLNPQSAIADANSIVGSWEVEVFPNPPGTPSFKNLVMSTPEGGNINSDPRFGTGIGVWRRVGGRTFSTKFLTLVPPGDPEFAANSTVAVSATLTLAHKGDEMNGPFETIITDPQGNIIASFDGTVKLTRIKRR